MRAVLTLALLLALAAPAYAQSPLQWHVYQNPRYGYSIDVPDGPFTQRGSDNGDGLTLSTTDGGEMRIYGGQNVHQLDPVALAGILSRSGEVKQVTYRAGGRNWLVLSGYYPGAGDAKVIFYTKFMFNPDRSALSAFEISYPASQKLAYDRVVTRLEKSLTPPR